MTVPDRVIERIKARIVVSETGCWLWQGAQANGYGVIAWHEGGIRQQSPTHRAMYEHFVGAIPAGMQMDHFCHDPSLCHPEVAADCTHRSCCNPAHLKPSTIRDNVMRGGGWAPENAAKTRCPQGHPYDETNTYFAPNGWRQCQICRREYQKSLRARRQAAQVTAGR